ncbi:hypothetical protein NM688_g3107 [Phlebia brevispora]|uniref:Uncharacterized protein n=1 Tax=Phlebia brevispora TaxID=194682 RepID=A0ACC1T6L1_9APHY|nr:hypothetical protein NM688_g3107 [Phlebia brevispora]
MPLSQSVTARDVKELYEEKYAGEKLVTIKKEVPTLTDFEGKHGWVVGGFQVHSEGDRVVVVGGLDNLLKGAATQCLQNLNLALGYDELAGIPVACAVAVLGYCAYAFWKSRKHNPKGLPSFPGPAPLPIVGNILDIPSGGEEWRTYEEIGKKYGTDVVFLKVFGNPMVVINSFRAANELLDKKGAIYSSRPRLVMINELMGWSWNLILMAYGREFLGYRKIVQQYFQPQMVSKFHHPVMRREVGTLLYNLLITPEDFAHHLKRMAAAIIMMITYGHQVAPQGDEYVRIAEGVREYADKNPGASAVEILPILKHIPSWVPGAGFKRYARVAYDLAVQMRNKPYQMVKQRIAAGNAVPCMVTTLLDEKVEIEGVDVDDVVQNASAVVYSAGADTTVAALTNFFLAMRTYPDIQKRAQAELDSVLGRERLPDFGDRVQLPYVSAIVKESLRWKAVSPLGVPHATMTDDEYRGRYIPQGTTVLANLSAMLHDESVYPEPDVFNPDRYLPAAGKEPAPDPARAAFGFGRRCQSLDPCHFHILFTLKTMISLQRICPGRFFADDSLFITIASILYAFSITHPENADMDEGIRWSSGLVSLPNPFFCTILPRFQGVEDLLAAARA